MALWRCSDGLVTWLLTRAPPVGLEISFLAHAVTCCLPLYHTASQPRSSGIVCVDPSKYSVIEGHQGLSEIHELYVPSDTCWDFAAPGCEHMRRRLPISCGLATRQKLHNKTPESGLES